jgi:alpha-tubulin suppressor-like RCC1 family protein
MRRAGVIIPLWLLLLACVLSAAQASDFAVLTKGGGGVAWGCGGKGNDQGQCRVPASAKSGVIAIAAGYAHSLALKKGGSVVAWGCGGIDAVGQCSVPASAKRGVIAIAAGGPQSLALKPKPGR